MMTAQLTDSLLDALVDPFFVLDVEGRLVQCNEGVRRVTGYPDHELRGRPAVQLFDAEGAERVAAAVEAVFREGRAVVEADLITRDGCRVPFEFSGSVLRDAEGAVIGLCGVGRDHSERRGMEQALREREELLEAVADAMRRLLTDELSDAIDYAFDRLGRVTRVDRVYLFESHAEPGTGTVLISQRYEWSRASVEPQIDNPELQDLPFDELYARWHRVLREKGTIAGLVADMPADERPLLEEQAILSLLVVPIHLDGQLWGFIGFDDCHEARTWTAAEQATLTAAAGAIGKTISQQRDRQALRESEDRLSKLFRHSSDLISILSPESTIQHQSPSVLHLLGYEPAELVGRNALDFVHPDDREHVRAHFARLAASAPGDEGCATFRWRHADGRWRWLEAVGVNLTGDATIGGILVNSRDVTARKEAEHALQESEREHRSIVENVRDVVFLTDAEGRWTYLNPAWDHTTGFEVDEALGTSFIEYIHPEDRARTRERFEPLIAREKAYCRHEVRYLTKDGGYRWIEVFATLRVDEGGRILGTAGTLHDVTGRKQAMEALERSLERERELSALKSAFVAMASHELRTPLTAIRSSAELLHTFGERCDSTRRETLLKRILGNTMVMDDLIEDVLLLGRVETGRQEFAPERLDLRLFCEALVEEFRQGAGAQHDLRFEQPEHPVWVEADAKLLRHVVANLLSNAVKYAPRATGVTLQLAATAGGAEVTVRDHGIGVPAADLPHLFEPFRRAANTDAHAGSGLGLAIAKRAVDLHGGTIKVDSVLAEGATFVVALPQRPPSAAKVWPDEPVTFAA